MRRRRRQNPADRPAVGRPVAPSSQPTGERRAGRWFWAALWLGTLGLYALGSKRLAAENRRLRRHTDRLALETHTDSLTGLKNRRYFLESIERDAALVDRLHADASKAGGRPEGIDYLFLFFDLDDFKVVNDRYGHEVGDRVLVQVRWLLENTFRESDDLVRWGGDEFLVVGRHTSCSAAPAMAERLREQIANHPFQLGHGQTTQITCSIGFACYPFDSTAPDGIGWRDVLTLADRAQYIAKRAGGNGWARIEAGASQPTPAREALAARIATDTDGLIRQGWLAVSTSQRRGESGHLRGL